MSAVMEVVDTRSTTAVSAATPRKLQEVIDRHLEGHEGLPTPELVATICKDPQVSFQQAAVLKYFLLESPLRARDLGTLLCGIGQNRAAQLCKEVAQLREKRLARGKLPRWEEASTS
jgi:hypothetical protein